MQEKYGLDCVAIENYHYSNYSTGGSYYKVWMRPLSDPEGETLKEKEGQAYLDSANYAQEHGPAFAVFVDATRGQKGNVIGDQYMWYTVYPIFDAWMNEQTSQFAPCQLHCGYLNFCTTGWEYDYCFPPDFPIISTSDELEEQFSQIFLDIRAFYPESLDIKTTQDDWEAFKSHLKNNYSFNTFSMRIYEVPDSKYEKITSSETAFKAMSYIEYECTAFGFHSELNTDSLATSF